MSYKATRRLGFLLAGIGIATMAYFGLPIPETLQESISSTAGVVVGGCIFAGGGALVAGAQRTS